MRDFKKIEIDGEIYLYPVPVIKTNKYLILCGTDTDADQMQSDLMQKGITHPDENHHDFFMVRHHTDGKTPIFVRENLHLKNS